MKKTSRSVFSCILSFAFVLQTAPVFASEEYKLNMTFNNLQTNQVDIQGLAIDGGKAAIAVTSPSNKGLYLKKGFSQTSLVALGADPEEVSDIVYSIDVMADDLPVNLTFGTAESETSASGADTQLFSIKNNAIITHDGKVIGTVRKNDFTSITVVAKRMMVCDYYVKGRKVLSNWNMPDSLSGSYVAVRQEGGNSCYIDNLRCYKGNKPDNKMSESAFSSELVDIIKQQDFSGDITYFDNRFCYTSGTPKYNNLTKVPKSNEIVTPRIDDYQDPQREDYIYLKRIDNVDDCYFDVNINMPSYANANDFKHRYLKMEGDFKANILQDTVFLIRDSKTTGKSLDTNFLIAPDGSVSGGGTKVSDAVKPGQWFHLVWTMNLDTKKFDVYLDGKKVLADKNLNADISQFNMFRIVLNYSSVVGDLYVDNFSVTGLVKPVVDGVETKTSVIADDSNILDFMSNKIGMHAIGNTLHKNGVKTELAEKGIYDSEANQYYVTADTLNKAFDLNLKDENGEITGDISVKADGTVILKDGKTFKLEYTPKTENGKLYVPVMQFAKDAAGKYPWQFKTGVILFADYELNLNTDGWKFPSDRDTKGLTGCTVWNDIDYLDAYLRYVRPDAEVLKADYISATGDEDFSQHPRLYASADDFSKAKEKLSSGADDEITSELKDYIAKADEYLTGDVADYTLWQDATVHNAGKEMKDRFVSWGIAYYITGDQKYTDAAFKQFEAASAFPDFNTANISDAGEAAIALAIGYDWFYPAFNEEQRSLALNVTRKNSLDILASGFYGRLTSASDATDGWKEFKHMSDANTVVNTGIALSALATLEHNPDEAFGYINAAMRSIEYPMQYFINGADNEGSIIDTVYIRAFASNIEKNFGKSYNIGGRIFER